MSLSNTELKSLGIDIMGVLKGKDGEMFIKQVEVPITGEI